MDNATHQRFLVAALGEDGAKALQKAVSREAKLAEVLLPRTVLAWTSIAVKLEYDGPVPGLEGSTFAVKKSEAGGYTGKLNGYEFDGQSLYHVAGALAVTLGIEHSGEPPIVELAKLGKSIDLLVKSRALIEEKALRKKQLDPTLGYVFKHLTRENITTVDVFSVDGKSVGSAEFIHKSDGTLESIGTIVSPDHQRKGIATALYVHAQKSTGCKVAPSRTQTPAGKALWSTLRKDELEKRSLDPALGYKISHVHGQLGGMQTTTVNAHSPTGEHVGYLTLHHHPDGLMPFGVYVDDDHQRRGIASAMLSHGMQATGKSVKHGHIETDDGAALGHALTTAPAQHMPTMAKTDLPGQTAKPTEAAGPLEATPPSKQPGNPPRPRSKQAPKQPVVKPTPVSIPGLPKMPMPKLKLSEAQLHKSCPACAGCQMKNGALVGCMCWRALAKSAKLEKAGTDWLITFGPAWDEEAIEEFTTTLKGSLR